MTHDYSTISVQMDERGVVSLRLDRAEKKNALSALMIEELTHSASNLPKGARVVVLSGAGDVFCAGGDLGWMKAQIDADRATRMHEARKLAMMLNALNELDAPLIGRVHGGAFGGGIGMCCVCDCVIAEQDTKFGLTETRLGLIRNDIPICHRAHGRRTGETRIYVCLNFFQPRRQRNWASYHVSPQVTI